MDSTSSSAMSMRIGRDDIRSGSPGIRPLTRYTSPDDVLKRFSKGRSSSNSNNNKETENLAIDDSSSTTENRVEHERDPSRAELQHVRNMNLELKMKLDKLEDSYRTEIAKLKEDRENDQKEVREWMKNQLQKGNVDKRMEELQIKFSELECLIHKQHALSNQTPPPTNKSNNVDNGNKMNMEIINKLEHRIAEQDLLIYNLKQTVEQVMRNQSQTVKPQETTTNPNNHHHHHHHSKEDNNSRLHSRPPRSSYANQNQRSLSLDQDEAVGSGTELDDVQFRPPAVHPMIARMNMKRKRNEEARSGQRKASDPNNYPDGNSINDGGSETDEHQHINGGSGHHVNGSARRGRNGGLDGNTPSGTLSDYRGTTNFSQRYSSSPSRDLMVRSSLLRSPSPQRPYPSANMTNSVVGSGNNNSLLQRPSSAETPSAHYNMINRSPTSTRRVEWADERSHHPAPPSQTSSNGITSPLDSSGLHGNDRYQDIRSIAAATKNNEAWSLEQEEELKLRVQRILNKAPAGLDGREDNDYSRGAINYGQTQSSSIAKPPPHWQAKDKENDEFGKFRAYPSKTVDDMKGKEYESRSLPRSTSYSKNATISPAAPGGGGGGRNEITEDARRFADSLIAKYIDKK